MYAIRSYYALKAIIEDQSLPMEDRFKATLKLAELPRNSSAVSYNFV